VLVSFAGNRQQSRYLRQEKIQFPSLPFPSGRVYVPFLKLYGEFVHCPAILGGLRAPNGLTGAFCEKDIDVGSVYSKPSSLKTG
jgi:hypothetical protein